MSTPRAGRDMSGNQHMGATPRAEENVVGPEGIEPSSTA